MGSSLTHSTPVCLVWHEFGGLNLDQWVLGNGQESILDQVRVACMLQRPNFASLSQMGTSLTHSTPICLVWCEFGGLNLDQWVLGNGKVSI